MSRVIHAARRRPRHLTAFVVAVGILANLLTSCAGSRAPLDTPNAPLAGRASRIVPPQEERPGQVDSMSPTSMSATYPSPKERGVGGGVLSGIGRLFSTPEGVARRQAVRLAKAAVPRSIGKGAVYAPNNTGKILNAGNKGGPVAAADSGATLSLTNIAKNKGAAATGPGATASNTAVKPGFWGALLGNSWWVLLLVALFLFRKRLPVVGPFFT